MKNNSSYDQTETVNIVSILFSHIWMREMNENEQFHQYRLLLLLLLLLFTRKVGFQIIYSLGKYLTSRGISNANAHTHKVVLLPLPLVRWDFYTNNLSITGVFRSQLHFHGEKYNLTEKYNSAFFLGYRLQENLDGFYNWNKWFNKLNQWHWNLPSWPVLLEGRGDSRTLWASQATPTQIRPSGTRL